MYSSQAVSQSNASFMSRVYSWMTLALVLSGGVAYSVANVPALVSLLFSNRLVMFGLILLQLGVVVVLSARVEKMSASMTTLLYLLFAVLTGVTFSSIFLAYTSESLFQAFFISASGFAGLSVFGFITKRDLGPLGSFCTIGLFGLIGFMLVTMLFPSMLTNAVSMTISTLGILIFAGLTAYDTQQIKQLNLSNSSPDMQKKAAITGALRLYLDFINLFLSVLRLFGDRR
jgi:FtsH-binding integral membrane protein